MISSVDLIEEQIRVAMGEKLQYKQVLEQRINRIYASCLYICLIVLWISICRKILFLEDIQLNVVSMQKMLLRGSDLGQVCLHMLNITFMLNYCCYLIFFITTFLVAIAYGFFHPNSVLPFLFECIQGIIFLR